MEIVYWIALFILVVFYLITKKNSGLILSIGFITFVISAILTVASLRTLAETIMRFSFIFWLVGIVAALLEYRKNLKSGQ